MPTATAPFLASLFLASRNPLASRFQPGVSALGKKKRTTVCLPEQSLSFHVRPQSSGKEKSGAFMSSFNMLPPSFRSLDSGDPPGLPCQGFLPPVRNQFPKTSRQKTPQTKASQNPGSLQSKAAFLQVTAVPAGSPRLDDVDGYLYHSRALFQLDLQNN